MWKLAGEDDHATDLARQALRLVARSGPSTIEPYWDEVTRAEASLLLGDLQTARRSLAAAAAVDGPDHAARASTRRQLRLVCELGGHDVSLLDALPVPAVAHYCGHRRLGTDLGAEADAVDAVRRAASSAFDDADVGMVYGSLAAGADLVIAEAALTRGAELHVVLPFAVEQFVVRSVHDAGDHWVERFRRTLEQATSVVVLDDGPSLGDDVLFRYASEVAMGRAVMRAEHLTGSVVQVAAWDGRAPAGPVGTASDVATWRASGRRCEVIPVGVTSPTDVEPEPDPREIRAMLFADVQGFGALDDRQMEAYAVTVLPQLGSVLDRHGASILNRRSWGDGLHVVFTDVVSAARCALDLQEAVNRLQWRESGFAQPLALRIGAHVGPVRRVPEPVRGGDDYTGRHIVRTARIEPRTPAGDVYVTDPFAALLRFTEEPSLRCQYVGPVATAKGHGTFPLYLLTRAG